MSKKLKKRIQRTVLGLLIFIIGLIYRAVVPTADNNIELILFLLAYLTAGGDVIRSAVRNIGQGQLFDETFLMTVASLGAFFVGSYPEAAAVMLFYQVGECFQTYAVGKSRKSISDLMNIRPDTANVKRDGAVLEVSPEEVQVGETIVVKPGEKVPLDAVITSGTTSLDTMALTGESLPRDVQEGEQLISGCVNLSGVVEARVTKNFGESTVSKILDLVENSSSRKAPAEDFITKFSRYYTPIVVFAALAMAIIPSILTGQPRVWIYRAMSFLVVSCPCALVISVPLSFFGGLGAASRAGILVKGGNYLEALSRTEIVVMDKTGTLTKGSFALQKSVLSEAAQQSGVTAGQMLEAAAYAESYSSHPISQSIVKAYGKEIDQSRLSQLQEKAGFGVSGQFDGKEVLAGNLKLMQQSEITCAEPDEIGTVVHVALQGKYLGYLVIADEVKEDSAAAVKAFYAQPQLKKVVMLTGDRKETAAYIAGKLGIRDVYAELLPGDKVDRVEALLQEKSEKGVLLFVGDGINDAPVLARADVGVAMGGIGSDAAIEAADVVIMDDKPSKISAAIEISHRTLQIARENIIFAIGIKVAILILAAFGIATMWMAIFADVGVAILAILNAMRTLRIRPNGAV